MSEAREEAERRWPRDWDVEEGTFRDGTVSGFTLGAEWQAARTAQVVPQPNREALAEVAYRAWCDARHGGPMDPAEYEAIRSRVEFEWMHEVVDAVLAALSPAPLTINREAQAKWLFEFKFPDHKGYWDAGHLSGVIENQYRKKADELAALFPAPLSIDREAETELQECIEQEIELGGDAGSIAAAVREFLARMSAQPVEGEVECPHTYSRIKFDGGSRAVVCNSCDRIISHIEVQP